MAFVDEIGGKTTIERVHTLLYDKLLRDPWLKGFFVGVERWVLEVQQTEFMADLFGAEPKRYAGRAPMRGHQHLFITEEIFMIRHGMLEKSLIEAGLTPALRERWLRYDLGMMPAIVKESIDDCEGRYRNEEVLAIAKP
jgi:hemoglobin